MNRLSGLTKKCNDAPTSLRRIGSAGHRRLLRGCWTKLQRGRQQCRRRRFIAAHPPHPNPHQGPKPDPQPTPRPLEFGKNNVCRSLCCAKAKCSIGWSTSASRFAPLIAPWPKGPFFPVASAQEADRYGACVAPEKRSVGDLSREIRKYACFDLSGM